MSGFNGRVQSASRRYTVSLPDNYWELDLGYCKYCSKYSHYIKLYRLPICYLVYIMKKI